MPWAVENSEGRKDCLLWEHPSTVSWAEGKERLPACEADVLQDIPHLKSRGREELHSFILIIFCYFLAIQMLLWEPRKAGQALLDWQQTGGKEGAMGVNGLFIIPLCWSFVSIWGHCHTFARVKLSFSDSKRPLECIEEGKSAVWSIPKI